jgi:hypothetical protein
MKILEEEVEGNSRSLMNYNSKCQGYFGTH